MAVAARSPRPTGGVPVQGEGSPHVTRDLLAQRLER